MPSSTSSMPTYAYEPNSYAFSGVSFTELPDDSQRYLKECGLVSATNADPVGRHLARIRKYEMSRFSRTLHGVHLALVDERVKLADITGRGFDTSHVSNATPNENMIRGYVGNVLIPEMRSHYEEFVRRMDALVWFEFKWLGGMGETVSEDTVLECREFILRQGVEMASRRFRELDNFVAGGHRIVRRQRRDLVMRDIQNTTPRQNSRASGNENRSFPLSPTNDHHRRTKRGLEAR